jgi:ABC-2 type transport system permease protein
MLTLLKKELSEFFSTLTGYVVVIVFTVLNGLFIFVFPGEYNLLNSRFAHLDTLFFIAPWIFLFLVPAITMRLFADERKSGTLELLYTKPVTRLQIILSKYLAGVTLVLFSLIPTFIYFISLLWLTAEGSSPDTGAIWGSYIGLFLLATVYTAIGIFASSLTENQIIAFLIAGFLSFFVYIGPDTLSNFEIWGNYGNIIKSLGIDAHYRSISRGVADTRDIIYFLAASGIFLVLTEYLTLKKK